MRSNGACLARTICTVRVLVTGSSGQIGTNLCLALLGRGDEVVGIDTRPNPWTAAWETHRLDLVELARSKTRWLPADRPDCIVHFAAWPKVYELIEQPDRALENVETTFAALELARHTRSRIIFASSREVYGEIDLQITSETMSDFLLAESPYSASKLAGEAFVYSYTRCYAVPHLVFRFSNVYGRYDNDHERLERVVPLFVRQIASGQPVTIYGRSKMLDFTFIDDCIAGVVAGIDRLVSGSVANETINIAFGRGNSLSELVELIERGLGRKAIVRYEGSRTGEVTRYVADVTKARRLLAYEPTVPLSAGIPRYIEWCRRTGWLRDHPD